MPKRFDRPHSVSTTEEGTRLWVTGTKIESMVGYTTMWHELVDCLTRLGNGRCPNRVARHLCRHADGGIDLLGITQTGTRGTFFDPTRTVVYSVPVSRVGIHVSETNRSRAFHI